MRMAHHPQRAEDPARNRPTAAQVRVARYADRVGEPKACPSSAEASIVSRKFRHCRCGRMVGATPSLGLPLLLWVAESCS